jgi:predicted DNA-binding transcriptional regulator YafY
MLLLLQARGRLTARQLADELEVSVRTVYRDAEALQGAGVPLVAASGRDGGYALLGGYRSRLTGLTTREAEALSLAGLSGPAAQLGLAAELAAAQRKLDAELPEQVRERSTGARERFHLDPHGWYREPDDPPLLGVVADAVWRSHRLRVRYRRWQAPEVGDVLLDPYGLVLKAGTWYLVAQPDGRDEPRTYRVNQVLEAQVLDERCARPADFDLVGHWRAHTRGLPDRLRQGTAQVRLSPRGRQLLPDLVTGATVHGEADADGWVRAGVPVEGEDAAAALLLRFGADVEVLSPPELRARLSRTARDLATLYDVP